MILKAKAENDNEACTFQQADLTMWSLPSEGDLFDVAFSMECLYYLQEPLAFLRALHDEWMRPGGRAVIGVDHYTENPASHDWGPSLNVHMALLSIEEWIEGLTEAGFVDVEAEQVGAKDGWSGTLVLTARRQDG